MVFAMMNQILLFATMMVVTVVWMITKNTVLNAFATFKNFVLLVFSHSRVLIRLPLSINDESYLLSITLL